jgi:uncharacterized protein (UPF0333 family)
MRKQQWITQRFHNGTRSIYSTFVCVTDVELDGNIVVIICVINNASNL